MPKFRQFRSITSSFQDKKASEIRKCTEWPHTDFEILIFRGPCLGPFCFMTIRFRDARSKIEKIGYSPDDLKMTLNSEKYFAHIHSVLTPTANFRSISLYYGQLFSEYRFVKTRKYRNLHRMTPDWLWTLNGKKHPVYTKYLPLRPKFWSVLLEGQPFSRYRTFYNSYLTTMLNGQKENKKDLPQFQISQFF